MQGNGKPELRWTRTTRESERPIVGQLHVIGSDRILDHRTTLAGVAENFPGETIRVDFTPWPD